MRFRYLKTKLTVIQQILYSKGKQTNNADIEFMNKKHKKELQDQQVIHNELMQNEESRIRQSLENKIESQYFIPIIDQNRLTNIQKRILEYGRNWRI